MPYCTGCQIQKPASKFYRNAARPGGFQARCKQCDKLRGGAPDRRRYQKRYRESHKAQMAAYRQTERGRLSKKISEAKQRARPGYRQKKNQAENVRKRANVQYRIATDIRTRLATAVRRSLAKKPASAIAALGCSVTQLMEHLEKRFSPGMSWSNWGRAGWHIDHIRPLASFDLNSPRQFAAACHYSNLQPLWAADNLRKYCKHKKAREGFKCLQSTAAISNMPRSIST